MQTWLIIKEHFPLLIACTRSLGCGSKRPHVRVTQQINLLESFQNILPYKKAECVFHEMTELNQESTHFLRQNLI